jgi:ACT domain-containing protein
MTKFLVFVLFGCVLQGAIAEEVKQTRDQCLAKCLSLSAEFPDHERHELAMKKIKAKREGVTDKAVIEELDQEEADEMDKYMAGNERLCRAMCRYFPETL